VDDPKVYGIIDVETTGLDSNNDEIIELSLILFTYNAEADQIIEIIDEYNGLREPYVPIKRAATKVHGITKRSIKGMVLDDKKIESMINAADLLIAHNANFDRGFITYEFPVATKKTWLCSMNGIKWKEKGYSSKGLQNLLKDHSIEPESKHRAGYDTKSLLELLSISGKNGKTYLCELLQSPPLPLVNSRKEVASTSFTNDYNNYKHEKEYSKNKTVNKSSNKSGCFSIAALIFMIYVIIKSC